MILLLNLFCLYQSLHIHFKHEETLIIQDDNLLFDQRWDEFVRKYNKTYTDSNLHIQDDNLLFEQRWDEFVRKYKKTYTDSNLHMRKRIFAENVAMIDRHNSLFRAGGKSYSMAVNHLADMTPYEIAEIMNGYKYNNAQQTNSEYLVEDFDLPNEVNWLNKNVVTKVKNQGLCGSCYAFSATGSLEGQYAIKNKKLKSYSEQNIIDCSQKFMNYGCDGGSQDKVFNYIKGNGGIDTEEEYPYEAKVGKCRYVKDPLKLSNHVDITEGNENELQKAVANVGPISVAIDANHTSFMFYSDGIYNNLNCHTTKLDHGVLVVGYGEDNGVKYWLVKNSWGPHWGKSGYIKMSRDKNNQCGIATAASYPVLG